MQGSFQGFLLPRAGDAPPTLQCSSRQGLGPSSESTSEGGEAERRGQSKKPKGETPNEGPRGGAKGQEKNIILKLPINMPVTFGRPRADKCTKRKHPYELTNLEG